MKPACTIPRAARRHRAVLTALTAAGFVGLAGLGGCSPGDLFGGAEKKPASILPLAVGNTWSYVDTVYYRGGGAPDSIVVDSFFQGITGTRAVALAAGTSTAYLSRALDPATRQPFGPATWLQDRADGNHTVGIEQGEATFTFETLHVKYPAVDGERYPTHFLEFRDDGGTLVPLVDTVEIEVVDTRHACTVPAGTFACVKYRGWRPGGVLHATGYYAPGTGFLNSETVRTEIHDGTERTVTRVRRLTAYALR